MNIHTLSHIHKLLIEDEERTAMGLKWAREARNAAEDEGDKAKLAKKIEEYEIMYRAHDESYRALQDFQAHEF